MSARPCNRNPRPHRLPATLAVVAAIAAAFLHEGAFAQTGENPPPPSPERQQQLIHLVRQDCGSCHGMTFKGGLGPPLTPDIMRDKPAESMVATILHGRPGTPMPPWSRFMNEAEATWIVERLTEGFPAEKPAP